MVAAESAPPQDARVVLLDVPDCFGAPGQAVKDLVALELAPRMRVVYSVEETAEPALSGSVQCAQGAPLVVLTVSDPARAEPLRVELDLAAAAPLARARLLALTLAELITTSQLEQPPPAAPKPEEPSLQPEPDEPSEPRPSSALQLWLAPALSIAGAPATALLGADVGAAYALGPVLLVLDAQARFGQSDRAVSGVAIRSFAAAAAVMPRLIQSSVQLSAGAGFRIGHIAMTGSSKSAALAADDLSGVWLGPALLAALQLPLAGPSALRVALEGGYVVRSVVGLDEQGAERMALRGPWLSASVGLALGLL
jgi:hypothetical protein